jgi:hypothetical protein
MQHLIYGIQYFSYQSIAQKARVLLPYLKQHTYKHPSCTHITANHWFKHNFPRTYFRAPPPLSQDKPPLPIQVNTDTQGLVYDNTNSSALCGMKFPPPSQPLQLIPDCYKDNTIATMKKVRFGVLHNSN